MIEQDERSFPQHLHAVSECGDIRAGKPLPLGAHLRDDGVNFAIFSRHATRVRIELFGHPEDRTSQRTIELNAPSGTGAIAMWEEAHAHALRLDYEQPAIQTQERADIETYTHFYRVLGQLGVPVCIIPGRLDAPERVYLQATVNRADIAPTIMLVHRGFAPIGRNFVVTGFGGYLTDGRREHMWALEYPLWEAEFGLHFLRHLEQDRVLLTHTPPAGRDLDLEAGHHVGAPAVNTLIKTVNPKFVFCGYALDSQGKALIGDSMVVHPGPLARGCYALVDTRSHEVFFGNVR